MLLKTTPASGTVAEHPFKHGRFVTCLLVGMIALLGIIFFIPVIVGGVYGDDQLNALTRGYTVTTFGNLANMIVTISKNWIGESRIYPFAFAITYSFWYAVDSHLMIAKIINVGMTLFCVVGFATAMLRITRNYILFALLLLLTPLCMQTRPSFDPIAQFPLLLPVTMLLITLQIWCATRFSDQGRWIDLFGCGIAFGVGLLTYELAIVAAPIAVSLVLLRSRSFSRTWHMAAAYAAILVPYVVAVSVLRRVVHTYAGIDIAVGRESIHSFLVNLYAAVPLGSLASPAQAGLPAWKEAIVGLPAVLAGILTAGYVLTALSTYILPRPKKVDASVVLIAVLLVVLPAALLSISKRYQAQIAFFGDSYLQVFVETFGIALLLSALVSALFGLVRSMPARCVLVGAVAVLCGALGGVGFANNVRVAEFMERAYRESDRDLLSKAVHYGLLEQVPVEQGVIFDAQPWLIPEFFPQFDAHLGHSVALKLLTPGAPPPRAALRVRILSSDGGTNDLFARHAGVVVLSRLAEGDGSETVLKVMSIGSGSGPVTIFSHADGRSSPIYDRYVFGCATEVGSSDVYPCSVLPVPIRDPLSAARP